MVQLNPVPVFGAKKNQYHLTEIFHRNFRTNGKRSRSFFVVQMCCVENERGGRWEGGEKDLLLFPAILPIVPATLFVTAYK